MKRAAVIGDPISHSISPILHNAWLKELGIEGEYVAKQVKPGQLKGAFEQLKSEGFKGFNITLPHKEAALEFIDEVEETAEIIGAVNTVVFRDGKALGFNTDAYGFWKNLKAHKDDIDDCLAHPVVLGAGGAARAVVYALEKSGAKQIHVIARDTQKAEALAEVSKNITISEFGDFRLHASAASLLINTTPIGMKGNDSAGFDLDGLSKDAVVTDIVYNPIQTELLKGAQARGNVVIDGLGMLIYQALPGFEAWFGVKPSLDAGSLQTLKKQLVRECGLEQ